MIVNKGKIELKDIFVYLLIIFAATATMSKDFLNISLYIAIPVAFIICFLSYDTIRNNKYIRILMCLYLWLCICTPLAEYMNLALDELKRVLGCFILSYSIASLSTKPKMIPWMYLIYCVLLLFVWRYASDNIIENISFGEERLGDARLNANHLAYYTFYVMFCIYILGNIVHNKNISKIFQLIFICSIIFSFITAIYTASRQILYIQIPFYFILLYHRYFIQNSYSVNTKILIILATIGGVMMLYNQLGKEVYTKSLLKERSSISYSDDIRSSITSEAIEVGFEHPLLGHGPGNSLNKNILGVITHNSFLELLVNTGLPSVIIYTYLICFFLIRQYRRWRNSKDKTYLLFLIFGLFWFLYQILYVFYTDLWLISFFFLVATHSEIYYNTHKYKSANENYTFLRKY